MGLLVSVSLLDMSYVNCSKLLGLWMRMTLSHANPRSNVGCNGYWRTSLSCHLILSSEPAASCADPPNRISLC